jgi:hypothetical protein
MNNENNIQQLVDYTNLNFNYIYEKSGCKCYASVNQHMVCDDEGLLPTGEFFVFLLDPDHGSCHFTIEKNDKGDYVSYDAPSYVEDFLIKDMGEKIDDSPLKMPS